MHLIYFNNIELIMYNISSSNQGTRRWYLCYHSNMYPVVNFDNVEDLEEQPRSSTPNICPCPNNTIENVLDPPAANSTMNKPHNRTMLSSLVSHVSSKRHFICPSGTGGHCSSSDAEHQSPAYLEMDCSNEVGQPSHIPRPCPPKPSTYTIPSIITKSKDSMLPQNTEVEELFGVIKLKQNDVCYTNGVIEWVGRKRNYPINSGFKILNDVSGHNTEPSQKRIRTQINNSCNKSFGLDETRECDCPDMLPTVNAIVDHLNALHEAVDIVDLRLNSLEGVISNT